MSSERVSRDHADPLHRRFEFSSALFFLGSLFGSVSLVTSLHHSESSSSSCRFRRPCDGKAKKRNAAYEPSAAMPGHDFFVHYMTMSRRYVGAKRAFHPPASFRGDPLGETPGDYRAIGCAVTRARVYDAPLA